MPTAVFETIG